MKFSVIIPVYNAESTLKKCLNSLLNQDFNDFEIVLVNDGSTDSSEKICLEYASLDNRIVYTRQENKGVSCARNKGLDLAKGSFVLFVDSDDFVTDVYFKELNRCVQETNPDFGVFFIVKSDGQQRMATENIELFKGERQIAERVSDYIFSSVFNSPCSKIYRRSLIMNNNLRFREHLKISEDLVFNFDFVLQSESLACIDAALYVVNTQNQSSLSRGKRDYLEENLLVVSRELFLSLRRRNFEKKTNRIYLKPLSWLHYRCPYSVCKEYLKYDYTRADRRMKIKETCKSFSAQNVRPGNISAFMLSCPVRLRMVSIVDLIIHLF